MQQRGLARAGGTHDHYRAGIGEPAGESFQQCGGERVTAEEKSCVVRAVGFQAPVGADILDRAGPGSFPIVVGPARSARGGGRVVGSIVGEQEIPGPTAGVAARFRPTGGGQDPGEVTVGVFESEPRRAGRITVGQKVDQCAGERGVSFARQRQRGGLRRGGGEQVAVADGGHREHVVGTGEQRRRRPAGKTAVQHDHHRPRPTVGEGVAQRAVGQGLVVRRR